MKRLLIALTFALSGLAAAQAATLDTVKSRGMLVCGVSTGFAGFSAPDSQGNYKGLDADYCRALAAATLGDPAKVRFVALTAQNRFTALQSGEVDVLFRNSTQTFLRGRAPRTRLRWETTGAPTRSTGRRSSTNGRTRCIRRFSPAAATP